MHNSKPYDRHIMNQSVTNDEFEAYPEPLIGINLLVICSIILWLGVNTHTLLIT